MAQSVEIQAQTQADHRSFGLVLWGSLCPQAALNRELRYREYLQIWAEAERPAFEISCPPTTGSYRKGKQWSGLWTSLKRAFGASPWCTSPRRQGISMEMELTIDGASLFRSRLPGLSPHLRQFGPRLG